MTEFLPLLAFLVVALSPAQSLGPSGDRIHVHIEPSSSTPGGYRVALTAPDASLKHDLHLTSAARTGATALLSESFQILTVKGVDSVTGEEQYDRWTPSKQEVEHAQNLYTDVESKAVFHVRPDSVSGQFRVTGLVDGVAITHNGIEHIAVDHSRASETHASHATHHNRPDFIDLDRNLTGDGTDSISPFATGVEAVVELVIVCDKEFGDKFGHDRQRVLDYLTVYMYDLNLRYKTLPSNSISFRVNGVVMISDFSGQPFIEEARASDGRAEFGRILDRYSTWVYTQIGSWPAFDLAPLITNTALEWGGGLAYMNAACWVDTNGGRALGTAVWNDGGDWGSLTVGAHELGHNLGAPHDDDSNYPGGCSDRGYIMSGGTDTLRWYFSSCSDRTINNFVRSSGASCLQRLDGSAIIDPGYASPSAPTMDAQCKLHLGPTAFIEEKDTAVCTSMRCVVPMADGGGWWIYEIAPVDNTICAGGGRCFRGNCRPVGYLFKNVGANLCMRVSDPREYMTPLQMFDCPSNSAAATALDRIVVRDTNPSQGTTLETPYSYNGATESGDACAWTGGSNGDWIWTDRCGDHTNGWHGWELRDAGLGNGQFLLVHKITGRCAKPASHTAGDGIATYNGCDANNADMRWERWM